MKLIMDVSAFIIMVLPMRADSVLFSTLEEEEILSGYRVCGISSKMIFIPGQCPTSFLRYSSTVK